MKCNSLYELNTQFLLILKPTYPINSIFRFDFGGDLFGDITTGIVALPTILGVFFGWINSNNYGFYRPSQIHSLHPLSQVATK